MPELPEVETIARSLRSAAGDRPALPGQIVRRVSLTWPKHVARPSPSAFKRRMAANTFLDVQRRGKYLLFPMENGTMLLHLRMSGDLELVPSEFPPGRFDRTVFELESGWELRFSDARKFGKIYLLDDPGEMLDTLGPEPMEAQFSASLLGAMLSGRKRQLKPLLQDQSFLAGLGNIYVDESLHRAKLHPLRRSDSLSEREVQSLWRAIRASLRQGLRDNGASIDWVYRGGSFQDHFRVYQRAGEACLNCGTAIVRIVVGQRGTHLCPHCQPGPGGA